MVELDLDLIHGARKLATAANLRYVNSTIAYYEESVRRAHEGKPYQGRFEGRLRELMDNAIARQGRIKDFEAMRNYCRELHSRSQWINEQIEALGDGLPNVKGKSA